MASGTGISNGMPVPASAQMGAGSSSINDNNMISDSYGKQLPAAMSGNTASYESRGLMKGGYIPKQDSSSSSTPKPKTKKHRKRKHGGGKSRKTSWSKGGKRKGTKKNRK